MIKTLHKILIAIFATAFIALGFWGFFIFKARDFSLQKDIQKTENIQPQIQKEEQIETPPNKSDENNTENVSSNKNIEKSAEFPNANDEYEKTDFLDIKKADCDNNCKDFTDSKELKYCSELCGLEPAKKISKKEGCEALSGLEKDYCFKDLAISKTDYNICEKIEDTGVLKTCLNRVTEDMLDSKN